MTSFAIAAEGITDQIILERLIEIVCRDRDDDIDVNFLQPSRDATDKHHAEHGGWALVLEYCRYRVSDALVANDYLVIQIDTDCGEEPGYGIRLKENGADRPQADIVNDACRVIIACLGEEVFAENADRIIFAVSVHSLESWLLLILHNQNKVVGSFTALQRSMGRFRGFRLEKSAACYVEVAAMLERKAVMRQVGAEHSLGAFLGAVARACADETADDGEDRPPAPAEATSEGEPGTED